MLDKDEFQAWKDSPATRWVLERHKSQATERTQQLQDLLLGLASHRPEEWTQEQPAAAHNKGFCEGVISVVEADYEELLTEDELTALKEAEEKAKE